MKGHSCACGRALDKPIRPVYTTVTRWGEVRIVRCPRCRLAQSADFPTPEETVRLYEGTQIYHPPDFSQWNELVSSFRHIHADLKSLGVHQGKILEVGCNAGYALQALHLEGFEVVGVEKNLECAQFASRQGLRVYTDLSELPSGQAFDVVLLSHVIEHIAEINPFLYSLKPLCGSETIFYIKTPNFGSFFARCLLRGQASLFLPQQHIWYFEKSTLTALLRSHGLLPLRVFTREFAFAHSRLLFKRMARTVIGTIEKLSDCGQEIVGIYR